MLSPFRGCILGMEDEGLGYYLYQIKKENSSISGLLSIISLENYQQGRLLLHEQIFPHRVEELFQNMLSCCYQKNPILALTRSKKLKEVIAAVSKNAVLMHCNPNGHSLYKLAGKDNQLIENLCQNELKVIYLIDGHHRFSAIQRYSYEKKDKKQKLMAVLFSPDDVTLSHTFISLKDKNSIQPHHIKRLNRLFDFIPRKEQSHKHHSFSMCWKQQLFHLKLKKSSRMDLQKSELLNIEIFRRLVLKETFGITDYKNDKNLEIKYSLTHQLQEETSFCIASESVDKILSIANSGRILEPNSTYFEPKLLPDLITYKLDNDH